LNDRVYKHQFLITVLSEEELEEDISLAELHDLVTTGPGLALLELASREEISDRDRIIEECRRLNNDGTFFTDFWDEEDEDV